MSTHSYISQLSPVLFWDLDRDKMDVEQYSAGLDRIVADCKRLRTLDPMALSFICAMSNTNKEDYRCYQLGLPSMFRHPLEEV